jgi:hypothetical protein
MKDKPLPTFSRLDKVKSVIEATAGVGCAVIIVHGINNRRWKRVYNALVASGICLDAFGFLKGVVAGRHSHKIAASTPTPASRTSNVQTTREPGTKAHNGPSAFVSDSL